MTPRNRMRKRKHNQKHKRAVAFPDKPSKVHLSYSRKKHCKLRTKTIKRYRKCIAAGSKGGFSGFSEGELVKGIIQFANDTSVKSILQNNMPPPYDDKSKAFFEDIQSLPVLMAIYSVIIEKEHIIETTTVTADRVLPNAPITEGVQLVISIGSSDPETKTETKTDTNTDTKTETKTDTKTETETLTKEIPNKILMKFVISKIREIERKNPHPDLLNTFLYFFDILDFPSAFAMVNLYLTNLYEMTKGKTLTLDKVTTYLEKNLAHHASIEDWKAALEAAKDGAERDRMYLKYTAVVNGIDPYERAQSELNALVSSAWTPFDMVVSKPISTQ